MGAQSSTFALPDATWNMVGNVLPQAGTLVRYRTAVYQMLGYVDRSGRWMGMDGHEETQPVEAWSSLYRAVSSWPERES